MDKIEYRAVIKFLHLKGNTSTEIKAELISVYGDRAPSFSTIKSWVAEFKRGRTSIFDEERAGRPKTATTLDIVEKVHRIVMDDDQLKLDEIAPVAGISHERVHNILHTHLNMRKIGTRWVPRQLTNDAKCTRLKISKECIERRVKAVDFFDNFITCAESWIHYGGNASPSPTNTKRSKRSNKKIRSTIFWDSYGILYIEYREEEDGNISEKDWASVLNSLDAEIKKKRSYNMIFFHHDNAMMNVSKKYKYELISNAPNSPDLAPCDYFLFPNLKKWLTGKKCYSSDELREAVTGYFNGLEREYFSEGIQTIENRWNKCIELNGDYVE